MDNQDDREEFVANEAADKAALSGLEFSVLVEEERRRWKTYQDAELDIAIAIRQDGDVDAAKAASAAASASWYRANVAAKATAAAVVVARLGVEPVVLKAFL